MSEYITDLQKLKDMHGKSITCCIHGTYIDDAKISIHRNNIYICHNLGECSGYLPSDLNLLGYRYSYVLPSSTYNINITELQIKEEKGWKIEPKEETTKHKYITTHEELLKLHGKSVTCKILGQFIRYGKICVQNDGIYVCHTSESFIGWKPTDALGYPFGWRISSNTSKIENDDEVTELQLKEENDWKIQVKDPSLLYRSNSLADTSISSDLMGLTTGIPSIMFGPPLSKKEKKKALIKDLGKKTKEFKQKHKFTGKLLNKKKSQSKVEAK